MATYYMRYTVREDCTGCGTCVAACPVDALRLEGDAAVVDEAWCIGCGVCVPRCPSSAAKLRLRTGAPPPPSFDELHRRILKERGLA